ncbi:MAG: hypothetical protein ACLFR0_08310, partial [Alphaproteobacteria bacterium]
MIDFQNLTTEKACKRSILKLAALFCLFCTATPYAIAQDLPDLSGLESPSQNNSPDGESPSLPPGPAGLDDDIFGLDEDFEFEKTPQQLQDEVRSQAFEAALQGLLPLRPEEIRILLERFDRTQESVETPIYPPP